MTDVLIFPLIMPIIFEGNLGDLHVPELPLGDASLNFDLPQQFELIETIETQTIKSLSDQEIHDKVLADLQSPIGQKAVDELVDQPQSVVIVVDDITRPTPAKPILEPLLQYLQSDCGVEQSKITFIFGLGVHRDMTQKEAEQKLGKQIATDYAWENHDCRENLVDLGVSSRGTPILINKTYYEADFTISLGLIEPHLWAGYSGGHKGIIPGIAGVDTIYNHHKLVKHDIVDVGQLEDNPFRDDLEEMVNNIGLDLLVNVVLTPEKEIHEIVIGEANEAFKAGVELSRQLSELKVPKLADIVISSPSPLGIDFRQSSKAAFNTKNALRKGGTMIVVSDCPEGRGNVSASEDPPKRWLIKLLAKMLPSRVLMWIIKKQGYGVEDAAGTFRMFKFIADYDYIFVSPNLSEEDKKILFVADHYDTLDAALAAVSGQSDQTQQVHIFPQGGATYPVLGN